MKVNKAYYVGIHHNSFRAGTPAEVIGLVLVTPENEQPRMCLHLQWDDGIKDYHPISDKLHYRIISFQDILDGNIPKITQ